MIDNSKRLLILLLAMLALSTLMLAANVRKVDFAANGNQATLSNNTDYGFDLQFKLQDFSLEEIQTKAGAFDQLSIDGFGVSNRIGEPQLPVYSRLIAVPIGAKVEFEFVTKNQLTISKADAKLLNRIIPAQASVSKSANPDFLPFELKNEVYTRNEVSNNNLFKIEEIGYMRGVRMFKFDYEPIQYNPNTGELKVCSDAYIKVNFVGADMAATKNLIDRTASYEYDNLYAKSFMNWKAPDRASLVRYPTKMLILCPAAYTTTLQPFVDWKKQQGYGVTVTTVGTGGTVTNTSAAIKTYMGTVWSAATAQDPAPTYLIIVGDTGTTGNNVTASAATVTSPSSAHVTDNYYVRLSGTDYVPEMYYGRFSVSSTTELTSVINKTITWEKTAMTDLSYLGKDVMIAGADATYGPTHGNGQINYGTTNYFNTAHGITSNTYLYPASESSSSAIIANAYEGRGYINYTAHGSETGWYSPAFSVTQMNNSTNTGKYGVMVGNCCLTNAFDTGVCFGESIIRKANAGGVAYIGGTNSTYWNEDYWWGVGAKGTANGTAPAYDATKLGTYDAMFHTHSEATTDWANTLGDMIYMGNLAVTQGGSGMIPYYWEIYSIMGDPSLMPYMGVPTTNTATFPSTILVGATSITVTATPYSRVALTMGGVTYGTDLVPAGGSLTLPITPFSGVGTAQLVITAQNRVTRIENITIAPNSGAYLTVDANTYNDTNNSVAEYNETGRFTTTFKNVGSIASGTATATLTCATAGITITDGTESLATLAAGASVVKTNAFSFTVANNIVNQLSADFTITMVSGTDTWTHNFNQVFAAPALSFGTMTISDPTGNNNGRLDPGETVTITMPLNNTGTAASPAGSATLTSPTSGITVNTGTASFSAITAAGNSNLSFSVTAASNMTVGTVATLVFNATAGAYTANKTETPAVGLILENFETGNFNSFSWIPSAIPWTVSNIGAHTGTYTAKSGIISDNGSTTMETTRILSTPGDLTFWYKVSSESNYDKLKFYIDGVLQGTGWSGTVDWTQATYPLTAGTRALKWEYMKDVSAASGSDCAWVDDIVFPASTAPNSLYPPQNFTATAGNGFVNLAWQAPLTGTPTGYKIFRNTALLTTVTALTYTDNAVVNETTYSYYAKAVYSGGESDPTATVNATPTAIVPTTVIIGTGTSSNGTSDGCPINVYYQSLHGQSVYTKAELNALGVVGPINITQIGFNVTGLPTKAMPNYLIRMGHTSVTNVSSWISTGLTTVWTSASYQPTATGWNMLTLSTPFLWNGTDNIVMDTAFGLIGSYASTGTTQYTTITSGYRYGRSDSADQTNLFTGTYTSTNRPNVKLALLPNASGPMIVTSPNTLTYGDVAVGGNSVKQFTIQNGGDQTLTGTITTLTGYTVALAAARSDQLDTFTDKDVRNTLSFSVNAGSSKTYNITLSPTAAITYNGNVVITSNAVNSATVNIAVTGAGFVPPTIDIDNNALYTNLLVGAEGTDSFTITNSGSQTLTYEISLAELSRGKSAPATLGTAKTDRSIAGSTLSLDAMEYTPGTTQNMTFTVTNGSTDTEWLKGVNVTFPTGVTVNSVTNFVGGSGGDLVPTPTSGNGITIDWFGETSSNWGVIQGGETATATVNVSIAPSFGGTMNLPFQIVGDDYNAEPHTLSGTLTVAQAIPPIEWFSAQPLSGSIPAGQSQLITGYFSAIGMAVGTYEATLTIHSNDPINPTMEVNATMDVSGGNRPPQINLPTSFTFEKNGSLLQSFASYISDPDFDPITLSVSGNSNVTVDISGSSVTFAALQNWCGTETITFTVNDGEFNASDNVNIIVTPTDMPSWEPVVYPTNPATVYAVVTIDNIPAQLNDVVAAFVNGECRATGQIVLIDRAVAYTTLVVNLANPSETVSFQIYAHASDTVYPVQETMPVASGAVYGETTPVPLNGTLTVVIAQPLLAIETTVSGSRLAWSAVDNATNYQIWACSEPYGEYQLIDTTNSLTWNINPTESMMFFKIKADNNAPAKGTK